MVSLKQKRGVGAPPKYKTPEEMQKVIDAYFARCEKTYNSKNPEYPTVTGLALALNMTRRTLLDYAEKNEEFSHTVSAAKGRVEAFVEQRLYQPSATGCIFALKNNFAWRDAQDVNLGGQKDNPLVISDETDEEIIQRFLKKKGKKDD